MDDWEVVGEKEGSSSSSSIDSLSASDVSFFKKTFDLSEETPLYRVLCTVDGSNGWLYISRRYCCFSPAFSFLQRKGPTVLAFRDVIDISQV